jgi:hypothetical protein
MTEEYYYTSFGKRFGPVPETQLKTLVESNMLRPTDLVWREGSPDWVPASQVPGLFGGSTAVQPLPSIALPVPARNGHDYAGAATASTYSDDNYYLKQLRRGRQDTEITIPIVWVAAGGLALLAIIGLAVALAYNFPAPTKNTGTTAVKDASSYTVDLIGDPQGVHHNGFHTKGISLNTGDRITISVKSERQSDVDLFLTDPNRTTVASDTSTSKDCAIQTTVSQTGLYTITVDNLGPGSNRCQVTYKIESKR